jgi:hypothetical protein
MGVIRKKIAARGGEGGVKYVCDVCSADITSTVRIHSPCDYYASLLQGPRCSSARMTHVEGWWSNTPRSRNLEANMLPGRSEFDAPIVPATNTTFASNASPTALRATHISPQHIPTASSNRIRSPSSTENGAPTRNSCFWREPRSTDWDHGRTSQTTSAATDIRMRSATIT